MWLWPLYRDCSLTALQWQLTVQCLYCPPPSRCRYNALEWMMPVKNTMNFLTKVRLYGD